LPHVRIVIAGHIPWTAAPCAAAESISPAGSGAHIPCAIPASEVAMLSRSASANRGRADAIEDVVGMSIKMIERYCRFADEKVATLITLGAERKKDAGL
jgi:hypothetical protein